MGRAGAPRAETFALVASGRRENRRGRSFFFGISGEVFVELCVYQRAVNLCRPSFHLIIQEGCDGEDGIAVGWVFEYLQRGVFQFKPDVVFIVGATEARDEVTQLVNARNITATAAIGAAEMVFGDLAAKTALSRGFPGF